MALTLRVSAGGHSGFRKHLITHHEFLTVVGSGETSGQHPGASPLQRPLIYQGSFPHLLQALSLPLVVIVHGNQDNNASHHPVGQCLL